MKYRVNTGDKQIEKAQMELGKKAWPEFMHHDSVVEEHWSKLYTSFLDFQIGAYSGDDIVGVGNVLALNWEGDYRNLPARGLDWALEKSVKDLKNFPVRPTQKHLYPLIPMRDYIEWTNQKGEAFDSWIRVHSKTGGKIVSICAESMLIKGTVNEWKAWTGLNFQSSGRYIVEKALCPVDIDLDKNTGAYIEPNVWIIHPT